MKAYRFVEWQQAAELVDIPVPEPGPGEVLVKVAGAGACHSDLHIQEWPEGQLDWKLPFTMGHENAGWVHAFGAGVRNLEEGEPVAVYGHWGCGRCRSCRQGIETYCLRQAEVGYSGGGLGADGGMAEYLLVPSDRFLVPLGELDPVQAAPMTDAALTPYHAVKRSLSKLIPGSTAVAIGVGGLGHMGVQILKALSPARVIAVDLAEDKLRLARDVGADETVISDEAAAERILDLTGGLGAEVVLDFVGADATMALGARVSRSLGDLAVVGIAGGTLPFSFFSQAYEVNVATTYWGSIPELMEVLDLVRTGAIHAEIERFPLEQVEEAYRRMRAGDIQGRAVIIP